jgi:hypothetical protein
VRRIGIAERRARLGVRHRLTAGARASTVDEAAAAVVALHATDPASVFLAAQARVTDVTVADIERALYTDRTVLRMLAMRRTMFVPPVESAPVLQAAASRAVADQQRRRYLKILADHPPDGVEAAGGAGVAGTAGGAGVAGTAAWFADVSAGALRALAVRGEATGVELSTDEPRLRAKVTIAAEKSYGGPQSITSWVLNLLALDARIVRARPKGTWISSQWRWAPMETWLPGGLADRPVESARVDLVRMWLRAFGPATVADLKWWTGWPLGQVRQALTAIDPVEVDLDGATGVVLPDDEAPVGDPEPWIALLPALDATPMGWAERSWYLGPHAGRLFDRNGNVGPTIWCDGRIVGGWAQRRDGEVVVALLEDVGVEAAAAVATAAAGLTAWIGPIRVMPRFRTPLERELTA